MSNVFTTQSPVIEKRKVIETVSTLGLSSDKKPKLSASLDANGKNISGVKDIECKTLNGEKIVTEKSVELAVAKGTKDLAQKKHTHTVKDIQGLTEFVEDQKQDVTRFAQKDHVHPVSDLQGKIPINKIEQGDAIHKALTQDLSNHRHQYLEKALSDIEKKLSDKIDALPSPEVSSSDLKALKEELKTLVSKEIEKMKKSKPKEETEIICSGYALIPKKCDGMEIVEVVGRTYEGKPVEIDSVSVGDTVKKNDVLSFPSDALVRISLQ